MIEALNLRRGNKCDLATANDKILYRARLSQISSGAALHDAFCFQRVHRIKKPLLAVITGVIVRK